MITENDIKKAVEFCCDDKTTCTGCPLNEGEYKCGVYLTQYLTAEENEPAPAASETSSKTDDKTICNNDTTILPHCQYPVLELIKSAATKMLDTYNISSEDFQRGFDMGDIYNDLLKAQNVLEESEGVQENE